jgi:hypothetical protein
MRIAPFVGFGLVFAFAFAVSAAVAASSGHVVAARGVMLTVPLGWSRVQTASDGPVTDPRTLLVVGTAGVRAKQTQCQIAAYRVPADGAVVVVVGWRSLKYSGAENGRPGYAPLEKLVAVRRPSFECFGGRGAVADVVIRRLAYQVNVMVGDRASKLRVAEALAVGRSFKVEP